VLQAPFQGETMAPESAWSARPDIGVLSPDETFSYAVSPRDGFSCIWAQRVDRATKRPVGEPHPVYHSHVGPRVQIAGIAIAADRMILTLAQVTSNVWTATWRNGW
jgi:hypothetical protein